MRRLSDVTPSNHLLFDALECGPAWDHSSGGAEVLLVTKALDEAQAKEASSHVHAMFDQTEVSCEDSDMNQAQAKEACSHIHAMFDELR